MMTETASHRETPREATEPLREDIRLLGGILGQIVREQAGDNVFDLVERARVESFRVRRSEIDRAELVSLFAEISTDDAIPVIRAFSHFALLANLAGDSRAAVPPGTSWLNLNYMGVRVSQWIGRHTSLDVLVFFGILFVLVSVVVAVVNYGAESAAAWLRARIGRDRIAVGHAERRRRGRVIVRPDRARRHRQRTGKQRKDGAETRHGVLLD